MYVHCTYIDVHKKIPRYSTRGSNPKTKLTMKEINSYYLLNPAVLVSGARSISIS